MIAARAARRFRLAGIAYAKGAALSLPDNQFDDLARCGLVERAPVKRTPKATPAKPKKVRRKPIAAPGNDRPDPDPGISIGEQE